MDHEVLGSGIEAHTSGHCRKMGALPVTPVVLEMALFLWLPGFSAFCLHELFWSPHFSWAEHVGQVALM